MAKEILKENFKLRNEEDKEVLYTKTTNNEGEETHHYSYFACTCSSEDKQYWQQRLHDYMPDHNPEVHASLVSQLCATISWDYNGSVDIYMDQWFGLTVSGIISLNGQDKTNYNISMQCDDVTLGLMAVVDILEKILVLE
ncbi:hypothetical protein GAP32_364 [Cronobacter phage vB_CsaM_GAP32]|uniref:PH domain-containing protein n=1 Tax=Cronobacter phage vB_CsaM_GAP32 TaxID=1141136 RepID=K4FB67_9CAUD|nr:hypothetical protein GAP32_364 [Cronobacter phage vB_CsaM_GAP32]AFC21814.1 hypothetical protein GAP32_364 [Cronobacter phage vB_CsaM_GAP32]